MLKAPSGVYTYFPIKSDQISDEGKASIADALVSRAVETTKNNLEDGSASQIESTLATGVTEEEKQGPQKADIERRRQEELEALPFDEDTLKVLEAIKKKDKARYARELRNKAAN